MGCSGRLFWKKAGPGSYAPPPERKPEVAQVTLSTIGDVSVATSEALDRASEAPKETKWRPVVVFFVLLYAVTAGVAWLVVEAPRWARILLVPLFPVLLATVAFWWRQRWKFRAKDWQFKLRIWEEALDSFSYEAANAVNAVRAQLIGFRLANPRVNYPEHLDIIQEESKRIDSVVRKSQDPVAWYASKKKKKKPQATPGEVGQETRSRIAL